jgi:hypothetical protein
MEHWQSSAHMSVRGHVILICRWMFTLSLFLGAAPNLYDESNEGALICMKPLNFDFFRSKVPAGKVTRGSR